MADHISIVGRGAALERVRPLLDGLATGSGGVALVSGEPGIGKTRFVSEVAEQFSDAGARVAWGRCQEITASQAYWPWLQALRSLVDESLLQELLPKPMWPRMHRLFPEFEGLAGGDTEGWQDEARVVLFDSLRQLLVALAAREPLALVLEDVHWSDEGSLRLIEFLAPQLAEHPIGLLVTYREQEARDHEALPDVVGGLSSYSNVQRVALDRLTEDETSRLLALELDEPTAMDATMVDAVYRRTAGNPFFIRQIGQMLNQPDSAGLDLAAVPPAVQDVIERRLSRLEPETRQFLEAAAVCGWEFRLALVREVDSFESDPAVLLEDAEHRGLIEADPSGRLGYRFGHHLVWEAVYQATAPVRRAGLHARAAEQLERVHRADRDEHLSMIASHLERGGDVVEPGHALQVFVDAGQQAWDQQSLGGARRWFAHAVELAEQQGRSRELIGLRARLGAALCVLYVGGSQSAIDELERVAHESLETGDAGFIGDAVYSFVRRWGGFTGNLSPELVMPLIEEALEVVGAEASGARARLMTINAMQFVYAWDQPDHMERARELADAAVAIAREVGNDSVLADALGGAYATLWGPRHAARRDPVQREWLELFRTLDRPQELGVAMMCMAGRRFEAGDLTLLASERDELEGLLHRAANRTGRSYLAWRDMAAVALQGDFAGAHELLEREEQDSGGDSTEMACRRVPSWLSFARHDGSIAESSERMHALLAKGTYVEGTTLDASSAYLALMDGDADGATEAMARVVDCDFVRLEMDQDRTGALAMLAEVAVELGDVERGYAIHGELRLLGGINSAPLHGIFGSTWRHLALLSRLVGELERAREEFELALEFNEGMGPSVWTGVTQADYAELLLEMGAREDGTRAAELYRLAAEIAESQGAPMLAERCRVALGGVSGGNGHAVLADGLTRREVEILRLIADGMTNNEIADALVISVRTVERHVTNAYGKIGARGRADATAYVLKAGSEVST